MNDKPQTQIMNDKVDEAVKRLSINLIPGRSLVFLKKDLQTLLESHAEQKKVLEWLRIFMLSHIGYLAKYVDEERYTLIEPVGAMTDKVLGEGPTLTAAVLNAIEKESQ